VDQQFCELKVCGVFIYLFIYYYYTLFVMEEMKD